MRMVESKFGVPAGIYVGKFNGIKPMKDEGKPRVGQDGRPMEPGVEWQWEVTEDPDHGGEFVGKLTGRITSPDPTTKNACGTLFSGVVGKTISQLLDSKEDLDPGNYVGFLYRLVVSVNKSDPAKTYVTDCKRVQAGAASPPPPPANRPKPPPAAKPAPSSPPPPAASKPEPKCWFTLSNGDPIEMTATEFRREVEALRVRPEEAQWMPPDQSQPWAPVVGSVVMQDSGEAPF